jgi:Protein of unknown function (DUF2397)
VLAEATWPGNSTPETVHQALGQLVNRGDLQSQPDTARVATIEDFYRKRLLYRMTSGGEAVEAGLQAFVEALARRSHWPQGRIQCRKILDRPATESGGTSRAPKAPKARLKIRGTSSASPNHNGAGVFAKVVRRTEVRNDVRSDSSSKVRDAPQSHL